MTQEKFTPGPWATGYWKGQCHLNHVHTGRDTCVYDYTFHPDETTVSCLNQNIEIVGEDDYGRKLSPANARLIAAAPELFKSLNYLQGACHDLIAGLHAAGHMESVKFIEKFLAKEILQAKASLKEVDGKDRRSL